MIKYFVMAALGYFIAGKFGLLLAIPPGFASAVWPASGLALACMLLLPRWPAVLGVGLGSFLLNLGVASQNFSDISAFSLSLASSIAMGAMLQAAFGFLLFRRMIGKNTVADSQKAIVRFGLVVAPVGCVVAPSVGVTALLMHDIISWDNYHFSWLTWWVGDTIGIFLFTPMLLAFFARPLGFSVQRKIQVAIPTAIIFTAVLILFFNSTEQRQQVIASEIAKNSERFFFRIDERLHDARIRLQAYDAFFRATRDVSRESFELFSQEWLKQDN